MIWLMGGAFVSLNVVIELARVSVRQKLKESRERDRMGRA